MEEVATELSDLPPASAKLPGILKQRGGVRPGDILFGEYEILGVLGAGGMGEVYKARHRGLGSHRAIKVMHPDLSGNAGAGEYFKREAAALLRVRHPAVVFCHDLLSSGGSEYLIMEMVEGESLSRRMAAGPLTTEEVLALGARLASGLAAAHAEGVVHRDLSPDNVILPGGRLEEAKLIDFGIAKIVTPGTGTIVAGFKGKYTYASPEQLTFGADVDGRSDLYSLGLLLAAAALGRPMPMGANMNEAIRARKAFANLPEEIPLALRLAIRPLLELDLDARPADARPLFVPAGRRPRVGAQETRRVPRTALAAAAVVTVAAAALGTWLTLGSAGDGGPAAVTADGGGGAGAGRTGEGPPADSEAPVIPGASAPGGAVGAGGAGGAGGAISRLPDDGGESRAAVPGAPQPAPVSSDRPTGGLPADPPEVQLTGMQQVQIVGLLANARLALQEDRLMSPADDNAYDRYRRVLALEPSNAEAREGLRRIASRYVDLAEEAMASGDAERARSFVGRAREVDDSFPSLADIESRLAVDR